MVSQASSQTLWPQWYRSSECHVAGTTTAIMLLTRPGWRRRVTRVSSLRGEYNARQQRARTSEELTSRWGQRFTTTTSVRVPARYTNSCNVRHASPTSVRTRHDYRSQHRQKCCGLAQRGSRQGVTIWQRTLPNISGSCHPRSRTAKCGRDRRVQCVAVRKRWQA